MSLNSREIKPGQLWLSEIDDMLFITCSKEPEDSWWVCMVFQQWEFGAFKREFNEPELNRLTYIGSLLELRNLLRLSDELRKELKNERRKNP